MTIAAARDDQHRDGPLRDSLGNIVKDGKPKGGGAWAGGGGKKGEWVEKRVWTREEIDDQDSDFGYEKFLDGGTKEGWLITFSPTTITHPETSKEIAAVECYLTMQVLQPPCLRHTRSHAFAGWLEVQVSTPSQTVLLRFCC